LTSTAASLIACCVAQAAMLLRNLTAAPIADSKMHAGTGNGASRGGFSPDQFLSGRKPDVGKTYQHGSRRERQVNPMEPQPGTASSAPLSSWRPPVRIDVNQGTARDVGFLWLPL
jgi:hypothetical protein